MTKVKFQFVESEVSKLGPTLQRIIRSGRQPYFDLKHWDGAKAYFESNPAEDTCCIFPSGEIWGEKELAELIQSRMSQVAFAQSHGWFPVVMGRNSIALWQPTLNTEASQWTCSVCGVENSIIPTVDICICRHCGSPKPKNLESSASDS